MTDKQKIFIVEDERRIARFLQIELEHEGFETETESNGKRAFEKIAQENFDLVLLDIMLPEMDGIEICRKVRELPDDVPIIMLTAKDDLEDKVTGLDIGANDYMTKPFAVPELLARIRAALRTHAEGNRNDDDQGSNKRLSVKDLVLYPERFEVQVKGDSIELTKKEYSLLEYLVRNKNRVLTRDQILQTVWGYDYIGDTNVVDVYIRYLRAKIEDYIKNKYNVDEKYIHTVRGVGYVIKE
ncbi:MAG: response regulator transcription factor [Selenomonadaceae bacterium]|nr:response regulator transcription factor [Selenomonadaceae bacterium]